MRAGVPVAAMEIMDEVQMMVVNKGGSTGKVWAEAPTLFFKFSGTKTGVEDNITVVKEIAKKHKAGEFEFARTEAEAKTLWSARKESLWAMLALRKSGQEVWSTDVAVPLSRLADLIGRPSHFFGSTCTSVPCASLGCKNQGPSSLVMETRCSYIAMLPSCYPSTVY